MPMTIASTHCAYAMKDGQAELTWTAGDIARCLQVHHLDVTHLSTIPTQRDMCKTKL